MSWKWTGKDTQRETDCSKQKRELAWHVGRDDSGREKTNYNGPLRDVSYKDNASSGVSDALKEANITDVQSLPSGYVSSED